MPQLIFRLFTHMVRRISPIGVDRWKKGGKSGKVGDAMVRRSIATQGQRQLPLNLTGPCSRQAAVERAQGRGRPATASLDVERAAQKA